MTQDYLKIGTHEILEAHFDDCGDCVFLVDINCNILLDKRTCLAECQRGDSVKYVIETEANA